MCCIERIEEKRVVGKKIKSVRNNFFVTNLKWGLVKRIEEVERADTRY